MAGVEKRAYRTALLATRQRDEALDIVQDAMLKLVQSYGERAATEWGPLFHRILHSRIHDWFRRRKVRSIVGRWWGGGEDDEADPIAELPASAEIEPSAILKRHDAMDALENALKLLPWRQQQVFLLRVWEGFDVAQTASVMGCGEGSVKTHFSRAVHALREKLGEHWP